MSLCRLKRIAENMGSDDRVWFINAINRWERGDQLDVALDLCGAGAITHRNLSLKNAANILNINNEFSTWHMACMLESAILRFETRILVRYRKNKTISLSEVDKHLAVMFEPGCTPVRKKRQLYDCIK